MWLLFLVPFAFAEEDVSILYVPPQTTLTMPGKSPTVVAGPSFLMPEPLYDNALAAAKKLLVCEPALAESRAATLRWIDASNKALTSCEAQFTLDANTVAQMNAEVRALELRAETAEAKVHKAKQQRNVAVSVAGGLILGAAAVSAVAIGF